MLLNFADQPPRSQSLVTIFWALFVRFVSGKNARLYSYQNSLPRMSVPPLKNTVDRFLRSVKPLLDQKQYDKMEKDAKVCCYIHCNDWLIVVINSSLFLLSS